MRAGIVLLLEDVPVGQQPPFPEDEFEPVGHADGLEQSFLANALGQTGKVAHVPSMALAHLDVGDLDFFEHGPAPTAKKPIRRTLFTTWILRRTQEALKVLLLQLDGKLPNIALMRIAAHCRPYADDIAFQHCPTVKAVEASDWWGFDRIYASLIFERTRPVAEALLQRYRFAEVGGTGWDVAKRLEDIGIKTKQQDYSLYPHYRHSIGFTQRGCRLKCPFCLTPGSLVITDEGLTPD